MRKYTQCTYYDLTVYPHHNYVHKGVISHNSGTTTAALVKAVRFMLNHQAPPLKDTPFWIITPNYEIGIKTLWKEKLYGRGILPRSEVDFERISWFEKKTELPISVPLKPWPRERGGHPQRNWMIEFKSWMSGREAMQAASIGGCLFSEQCPWDIVTETYVRCRDFYFPGGQMYEFTPVDPAMTAELEAIVAQGKLPESWKVYRGSTIANAKAGHVSSEWLKDFTSMISDEARDTRLTGAFPAFEGVIYPNFRIPIHTKCSEDVQRMMWEAQKNGGALIHRRGVDWGTGPSHPFVALFGARDWQGRWYIYDEIFSEDTMTSDEVISLVMNKREWPDRNPNYGTTYADPSRPDLMRAFSRHMSIMAANNSVHEGIESVRVALKVWEDGYPGLIIDGERCPNLVRQLRGYRWLQSPKTGLNPRAAKPEPLKRDDDCPDALRYLLHSERRTGGEMMGSLMTHREVPTHLLASHRWGAYG